MTDLKKLILRDQLAKPTELDRAFFITKPVCLLSQDAVSLHYNCPRSPQYRRGGFQQRASAVKPHNQCCTPNNYGPWNTRTINLFGRVNDRPSGNLTRPFNMKSTLVLRTHICIGHHTTVESDSSADDPMVGDASFMYVRFEFSRRGPHKSEENVIISRTESKT